jgi:hypothetical protein
VGIGRVDERELFERGLQLQFDQATIAFNSGLTPKILIIRFML